MLHQNYTVSRHACIETLESRQLLSASPIAHAVPARMATHAVKVKVKPTIPAIAGATYSGTFKALGHTFTITFAFGTETAKGALTATVTSNVSAGLAFVSAGTVKTTKAVALHGKSGVLTLAVTAKLNATLSKLTGRAVVHGKQSLGTAFSATLVTPV